MLSPHLIAKTEPEACPENLIVFGDIRVSVLGERLFRIEKDSTRRFCDKATQCVWFRNMKPTAFDAEISSSLRIKTSKAEIEIVDDVMNSTVRLDDGRCVTLRKIKNLPGAYRSLDGCDGDAYIHGDKSDKIKLEDGIVSSCGVGIHIDTDSLVLNDDGRLEERADDELDIYVFAHGYDFRGAIKDLYMICGNTPIVPKYALGNWWSRFHEYSEQEYLHIVDRLGERDIPITVATVDMDWHWYRTLDEKKHITADGKNDELHGGAKGWTGYSWNTDLFPDYKRFLRELKKRGLKVTLNLHPAGGIRYFEDMYPQMAEAMGVDAAEERVIAFDFTADRFINAYFDIIHKPYERDGVDFWWIDWQQGTSTKMSGLDPLWALNHYHTLDISKSGPPLILSRYCKIGSHRYPVGFSGDTYITWRSLNFIPYFTAMGTNAGYTWWSHDIGGHFYGEKDDELYLRYVQFGAFSPIMRLHCMSAEVATKEPMYYMNGTGLIAEEFLRLRHRMIPFLYSESYNTHINGSALIEPMYYAYPAEKNAFKAKGQYMFARNFIVAPITGKGNRKGLAEKRVWLPEGKWTDIFTQDEYTGGGYVDMVRWQNTIPVLAGEGAIFVLDGRRHTNSISDSDRLEIMVFNGNGEYTLHEGGEESPRDTYFTSYREGSKQVFRIHTGGDFGEMPSRTYKLLFKNIPDGEVKVLCDNQICDAHIDGAGECLSVTLHDTNTQSVYEITVCCNDDRRAYRNNRLLYSLMRLEGDNMKKNRLLDALCELDDADAKKLIEAQTMFTNREKKRLTEAW